MNEEELMQQQTQNDPSTFRPVRSERERFLAMYERESATTQRVIAAYPTTQAGLKPSDRSNSAEALLKTFVTEHFMMLKALRHEEILAGVSARSQAANTWEELVAQFDRTRTEILQLLRSAGDSVLDGTVTFFVAPKQTGQYSTAEFVTFMLHDQIHHRGQMTVYLRIAGAKVPSIYGPTADEPWN
jgi:uncharacterized damage-inducible protein DinB